MTVTAEGIETEEQRRLAAELGCERGQGFLFSRPIPAAEATELLLRRRSPLREVGLLPLDRLPSRQRSDWASADVVPALSGAER